MASETPQQDEAQRVLALRERSVARAEDVLAAKVQAAVLSKLAELEIKPDRVQRAEKVFQQIAGHYPATIGKAVSKKAREDEELTKEAALVYGEIQFGTFALAMEKIRYKYGGLKGPGGTFVDIGSGTGKPVFAAMLLHEFDKVVGIEILHGLHDLSLELLGIWHEVKDTADVSARTRQTQIELVRGDALVVDWRDADLAFVNSTCFDSDMMELIAVKADQMRPGSFFVSFTRRLPSDRWQVLEYERHIMSWGEATVFIHQRKADDPDATASASADAAGPEAS